MEILYIIIKALLIITPILGLIVPIIGILISISPKEWDRFRMVLFLRKLYYPKEHNGIDNVNLQKEGIEPKAESIENSSVALEQTNVVAGNSGQSIKKRIVIGQFNDSFPPIIDGVANVVLNYARWLNNDKSTCCVVTPKHPDAVDNYNFDVYRFDSIKVPTRNEFREGVPQISSSFWMSLKKIPFDIVHAHCPFSSGLAARSIARKRNIPLVATFHSKFKDDFKAAIKSDYIVDNILLKIAGFYESADEVWIVNEASEETLREYGYRGDVYIMGNGCDIEPQYPTPEALNKVNEKYGLTPDVPLFMYVGQHTWQKNLQMVIEALGKLKAEGERFHMLFVGDGAKRADMEQMVRDLNLTDSVTFAGRIHDREAIAKIYLRSSAMLFPSLYDTSSLVPREAAACGCPTVFVKGTSTSQGITDKNGYLIENTADSLVETLRLIINKPDDAKAVGEMARKTIYRSWQDAVEDAYMRYIYLIERKRALLHSAIIS